MGKRAEDSPNGDKAKAFVSRIELVAILLCIRIIVAIKKPLAV
jgi:hypothetical protein